MVKEQAAASFVDTSRQAIASTQQFYQDLVSANDAYNDFRWAVDAQCPVLSPGEQRTAPGIDDPTALPLAIEQLPSGRARALPAACQAYAAQSCRHESAGALRCHPLAGTVAANGFFCPSQAAQRCAAALTMQDWKRVSPYTDNPLKPDFQYISLASSDFAADTESIRILTRYLDSLAALTGHPGQDVAPELGEEAKRLQTLGESLKSKPKSVKVKAADADHDQASSGTTGGSGLAAPLSSLAGGIQSVIAQGGSTPAVTRMLSQPQLQSQVSDAIGQLARAVDEKFCTTQPVDALRSAADIKNYLSFGYGPNDLAAREALVKQAVSYQALVESNLGACRRVQQANASGDYRPASPAATLLIGIKQANDALVKQIVDGQLTDAQQKKARQISLDEFKAAVQDAVDLATALKGL
ncbi:hypothetical protein [Dyella mobilis]|uniref:Uncharacterized protein n=1 Tax=Dyella mobilis TaxID=1849582 RepID=A0ABS2KN06_9GAMM|nr:hypothetical protein [Dyella mobilis]MBM7131828.1 hypothetical protein [Dyella mobilis]